MVKRRTCDTCEGKGEVLDMVPGSTGEPVEGVVECPDCEDGTYVVPTRLDLLRRDVRSRVTYARSLWRDRNATAVAAYVYAHRNVLDDEPRLRGLLDHELREQIDAVRTPLGWRKVDLRWSLLNAWRAVRGRDPLPLPYDVITDVSVRDDSGLGEFFHRPQNLLMILAERHRRWIVRQ